MTNQASAARRPLVAHLTTTDISLALLLGAQLRAFREAGYDVVGISAPGPFVAQLEGLGIPHIALKSSTRSRSLRRDLSAAAELRGILGRIRPDILHTHNPKPGIYGRLIGHRAGVPIVVNTVHGLYASREDRLLRRLAVYSLERLAAGASDGELVQNPEDLETLRHLGVPLRRLHLLGNGVDLGRFKPADTATRLRSRETLGYGPDHVVVGAVGRLVWEKGYAELFAAARALSHSHPKLRFLVAGPTDTGKADALDDDAISAAGDAGVTFLGHRSDIEAVYAAIDVYVLASYREGFPRSAMEAAAMGIPVIATDIRGGRQVVDDALTGLLVPPRDSGALVTAIRRLAEDEALRLAMGRDGRDKALRDFDQDRVIETTLALYERLLQARANGNRKVS